MNYTLELDTSTPLVELPCTWRFRIRGSQRPNEIGRRRRKDNHSKLVHVAVWVKRWLLSTRGSHNVQRYR